jgi:hypothetical protein
MNPAPRRPRRLSARERWRRILPYFSDAEFVALIAESDRLLAAHPELPTERRWFMALAAVRARQRAAAEVA